MTLCVHYICVDNTGALWLFPARHLQPDLENAGREEIAGTNIDLNSEFVLNLAAFLINMTRLVISLK